MGGLPRGPAQPILSSPRLPTGTRRRTRNCQKRYASITLPKRSFLDPSLSSDRLPTVVEPEPSLLQGLAAAFLDDGPERSYYYDRDTARMVSVAEDHEDFSTQEIVWQLESDTRNRFVPVPKPRLEDTLDEQDAFVESLPDGPTRRRLERLVEEDPDGSKLARLVIRDPGLRPEWRRFRAARARIRARAFLNRLPD